MSFVELPLPKFFNPLNAANPSYVPNLDHVIAEGVAWKHRHNIQPAWCDRVRICLLIVDAQGDFCFKPPFGTLYVGGRSGDGAIDDNARLAAIGYRNLSRLTKIFATLDTHVPFSIFFPEFWVTRQGNMPDAFTRITPDMIGGDDPELRPNPVVADLYFDGSQSLMNRYVERYVDSLNLIQETRVEIWPHHCMKGTPGHSMVGVLSELMAFHSAARSVGLDDAFNVKGENPLTEYYSPFMPNFSPAGEGSALSVADDGFLNRVLDYDAIIVAGQASSHCVRAGLRDMLIRIISRKMQPGKVYILTDCMSAVTVPDGKGGFIVDFTQEVELAMRNFSWHGMHLVESTTPMEEWPDFPQS